MHNVTMQHQLHSVISTELIAQVTELSGWAAEIDVREARKSKAEYKAMRGRSSYSCPPCQVTWLPCFGKRRLETSGPAAFSALQHCKIN